MLGRAVSKYQPQPPRRNEPVQSQSTSSPTTQTTFDNLKPSRWASSSIGGYTAVPSSNAISLDEQSRSSFQRKSGTPFIAMNPPQKRSLDGLAKTLSSGSFRDESSRIAQDPGLRIRSGDGFADSDLSRTASTASSITSWPTRETTVSTNSEFSGLEFDPDEFDNDSELDLDVEYPQALPHLKDTENPIRMPSPTIPPSIQTNPNSNTPITLLDSSGAVAWSSSPAAHKQHPLQVRRNERSDRSIRNSASGSPSRTNVRPAKRRTVPWLQGQAEKKELEEQPINVPGLASNVCLKCHQSGHLTSACPTSSSYTSTAKDQKPLPWNTTASAVKNRQKHKKVAKENAVHSDSIREAVREHRATHDPKAFIYLSEEQQKVLNLVTANKKSVFFTGSAGTGKSVLMRAIIAELRRQFIREPDRVAVTASTGLAACNIGGVTLHSFGGIGLGKEEVPELVKKINRNAKAKQRWLRTKILIIDEISMVDGALFDKLEGIARSIRRNGRPFGGIQLVITGDFFQLPPVPDFGNRQIKFAFDAGTWSTSINHTIGLTEVFRQRDPVFANMLNEMRLGRISDETVKAFRRLDRPIKNEDSLEATELFPTRAEVERANLSKMKNLQGKIYTFEAIDGGTMKDTGARDKLLSNCMAPPTIELKKGAQVMLIKNIDENLVNGSLGSVVAFMTEQKFEIYDEDGNMGTQVDSEGTKDRHADARKRIQGMLNKELVGDTSKEYPLVRFSIADGTTRDLLCQPEDWKVELPNGEVQAQRRQLPLILAWALSIHKAQGQTLERVKVDLKKVFENGQAYVALSRATCQDGLQVSGFDKNKVTAHPRVAQFYKTLYSANKALEHPKVSSKPNAPSGLGSMTVPETKQAPSFDEEEAYLASTFG